MRTIKFRAWDTDGKKMYSDILENVELVCEALKLEDYEFTRMLSGYYTNIVIQQFTGLLDKNGKEIYEGDIMNDIDWGKGSVVWNEADSQWILECKNDYTALRNTDLEVLGNVMENPELLKS